MSYKWSLSGLADAEILRQSKWYLTEAADSGIELASRWNSRLQTALDQLAAAPRRFGFAPENGKWLPQHQIRQMLFRPWNSGVGWRVLYTIDEKAKLVTVLQVRHERRRYLHESEDEDAG